MYRAFRKGHPIGPNGGLTEWRNGMAVYTENPKIRNIRNILKDGIYTIFLNKTRNIKILKRRIREKSFKKDIHVYSQLS